MLSSLLVVSTSANCGGRMLRAGEEVVGRLESEGTVKGTVNCSA
jgi:hypothetical protein